MTLTEVSYLLAISAEIVFLVWASVYLVSLIFSWIKGAPYVATTKKDLKEILIQARLKKSQFFVELGCGDGRVLRTAQKEYGISGLGIDINPILIFKANFLKQINNQKSISFKTANITQIDLKKADIIYIYLFPKLIDSIKDKLLNEPKKGTLVISHGFKIDFLKNMTKTISGKIFKTYFYRIR